MSAWRRRHRRPAGTEFTLNRVCNIEDFTDPVVVGWIRRVFKAELAAWGSAFPQGRERRKLWEVALALAALERGGALTSQAEVLGVGAGNEPTLFDLTRRVRRVFATDIYLGSGAWQEFANEGMLVEPSRYWPGEWNRRRLVVQHMSALELDYEDDCFSGVFSSSSFEHFGTIADVKQAVREVFRVLRPSGVFSVSTEYRLDGPAPGFDGTLLFDRDALLDVFVQDLEWDLMDQLDLRVSASTLATEQHQSDIVAAYKRHFDDEGELIPHRLELPQYPEVVIRHGDHRFTSVHLALRKRG